MNKQNQKNLRKEVLPYEKADSKKSVWQLINTIVPFFTLWILAYYSLSISTLLTVGISVVNAGFLVRMFIIFHDCCHYSFFKNRKWNKIVGTCMGMLTLFPYNQWQHSHSIHHATSGNLDKRGIGDLWVLTVNEYLEASKWTKMKYKMYRNPFVMFIIGPVYVFLIAQRFNKKGAKRNERINTYITNIVITAVIIFLGLTIGWKAFLMIQIPIFMISGTVGVWLFYVQHQFEDTYFEWEKDWEYVKAAVEGSSFYKLPKILQWITGNIGFHHVHHLSPRVPNYNLEKVHINTVPLQNVPTITVKTSLNSLGFRLWDEENKKFISFRELKNKSIKGEFS